MGNILKYFLLDIFLKICMTSVSAGPTPPQDCTGAFTSQINVNQGSGNPQVNVLTLAGCNQACLNDVTCLSYDWSPSDAVSKCWLHSVVATLSNNAGITHYRLVPGSRECPIVCLPTWNVFENKIADGAVGFASDNTVADCQTRCIANVGCVGFDFDPSNTHAKCWLHLHTINLAGVRDATGVSHHQLTRTCGGTCTADILFIVDSSGSIDDRDLPGGIDGWTAVLNYITNTVNLMDVGQNLDRISLITFSNSAQHRFRFNTFNEKNQILLNISGTPHSGGYTNTPMAFTVAKDIAFQPQSGDRPNVVGSPNADIIVLITDGEVTLGSEFELVAAANFLKNRGVQIIGVALSLDPDFLRQIEMIVTDNSYQYTIADFSELATRHYELYAAISRAKTINCGGPQVPNPAPSFTPSLSDTTQKTGCVPTYQKRENANAQGARDEPSISTVDGCKALCVSDPACVALDYDRSISPKSRCWIHTDNKVINVYNRNTPNVDMYVLLDRCTGATITTPRTTTRTTTPSTTTTKTTTPRTTTTRTTTPRTTTTTTTTPKTTTTTTTFLYTSSNGPTSNQNQLDAFTCTFETSICGLTIEGSDYTWSRLQGSTPSSGTGPVGGDKGSLYYLYTEATDKTAGDIASLVLPKLWSGQVCLSFSAHMFGEDMGKLTLYTQRGYTGRRVKIFEQSGNQNNNWKSITINIDIQERNSKIVFEAERGPGYRSDIAIDNVHLKKEYCESGMVVTNPDQSASAMDEDIFSCDFENGACGASLEGSDFIWSRHTGSTPSSGTGPHSGYGGSLFYLYTEATDRTMGDKALMVIQRLGIGQVCVKFFVHMYGEEMGNLILYTTELAHGIVTKRLELLGDQGNLWKHIETTFYINSLEIKLIFEAVRGHGYRSDIAIDNIRVSKGYCPNGENTPTRTTNLPYITNGSYGLSDKAFSCDFEYGLCEMTQDKQDEFDWQRHTGETPTWDTGPSSGYSSLHYLYAEVSNYSPGDRARIVIDIRALTGDICLSFFYHMYGKDIGKLTLFWKRKNIYEENEIWSTTGNQGNTWLKQKLSLRLQQIQEEIGFQSTRGQGNEGDIAIDNIEITKGMCIGDQPPTEMPDQGVFTCGEPSVSPKISRVVGGEEAIPHSWPWMALVTTTDYRNSFCGGSLIANNWVLTAAHCLPSLHTDMFVTLGLHNRFIASNAVQIKVLQMIPHPGYDRYTKENDIMLLKLEKSVTFEDSISTVCLPNPGQVTLSGTTCVSTGWGHTNADGTSAILLHQVAINLISKDVCNGPDWYNGSVGQSMLCVGHQYGGKDTCHNDSGGPLVVQENGHWILVGIVSWGEGCAVENKPGVYSDVAHNINWILQNMT